MKGNKVFMIRIILGGSVALIALFCFAVAGLLAGKPAFEVCRPYLAGGLTAAGVAAWFFGRFSSKRRQVEPRALDDDSGEFSLRDLRYWGPMLVILGVITLFIWPLQKPTENIRPLAAVAPKKIVAAVAPTPAPKRQPVSPSIPVKFPALKIQGIIMEDDSAFAIINGRSYAVGDHVAGGDVVVKAIERHSVAVELKGQIRELTLN
jgi:hypothetical protein